MAHLDWPAERFGADRPRLHALAYRMLGSPSEADDAVQEAWLRLNRSDTAEIQNLTGWLTTVTARVCLDMLRARTSRREEPIGTGPADLVVLPTDPRSGDPEHEVLLADSVGLALLVVLDTLAPAERIAFVLHDLFDLPFEEIAPIVDRSPAAAPGRLRGLAGATRSRGRRAGRPRCATAGRDDEEGCERGRAYLLRPRGGCRLGADRRYAGSGLVGPRRAPRRPRLHDRRRVDRRDRADGGCGPAGAARGGPTPVIARLGTTRPDPTRYRRRIASPAPEPEIVTRLRTAGCVFAADEAALLAAAADTPTELDAMVAQRVSGVPLEIILGYAEFHGLRITVAPGVFVPRRRTEFLVDRSLAAAPASAVIVDMCCGSGAVAAAVLTASAPAAVYAVDIDPVAVTCARRNLNPLGGAVLEGDLFDPLPSELRGRVDVIVANAPYVPTEAIVRMPPEARLHEPRVALDGGVDGLDIQRRVIAAAPDWLTPGGQLLVETSARQATHTLDAFSRNGFAARVASSDEVVATVVIGTRA